MSDLISDSIFKTNKAPPPSHFSSFLLRLWCLKGMRMFGLLLDLQDGFHGWGLGAFRGWNLSAWDQKCHFWERFCPGWWHGSAGRQDRREMLKTLGRAALPAAITTNVNGHHQPFWWDTRATLGYREAQLSHPEDCKTAGLGSLAFRHWFFLSTGGWSHLTSPHKSLSSWKMSTILFCRTCFQAGGVCTKRSVLHQQATYYLAEKSTQPALPKSRPGIKLQLRLFQLSDPVVPWGGNGSHANICAGSFTGESEDIVHLLCVPLKGIACYNALQHTH